MEQPVPRKEFILRVIKVLCQGNKRKNILPGHAYKIEVYTADPQGIKPPELTESSDWYPSSKFNPEKTPVTQTNSTGICPECL